MTTTEAAVTTNAPTVDAEQARLVANEIKRQITLGVWMSLGASDPMYLREQSGGLTFIARLIPRGQSAARRMRVTIHLTARDDYSIEVGYLKRNGVEWVEHFTAERVYCDSLARTLLALDNVL